MGFEVSGRKWPGKRGLGEHLEGLGEYLSSDVSSRVDCREYKEDNICN